MQAVRAVAQQVGDLLGVGLGVTTGLAAAAQPAQDGLIQAWQRRGGSGYQTQDQVWNILGIPLGVAALGTSRLQSACLCSYHTLIPWPFQPSLPPP